MNISYENKICHLNNYEFCYAYNIAAKENLEFCTAISKWLVEKSYNIKNVK